ncbi:MAG TPA: hypothetical protein PKH37_08330, partial [Alphaproteobacteria bacterium]|nr:hypothetical protein [Alphaproteobacteria bacterium]
MFFLFLALFASFQVLAGDADESRFSRLAEDSALRSDAHSFLSFAHENDLLAGSGDKFYTSGAQITYFNVRSKPPVFIKKIVDEWGGFDIGDATL